MKYISQLTDEQIIELMSASYIVEDIGSCKITRRDDCIFLFCEVSVIDEIGELIEGVEDTYTLYDYDVQVYDWFGDVSECRYNYRKKLLEWFGEQYAIDGFVNGY